ncbi:MAG: alpha/beta hydrolase [Clostridia bacterium]|nr:alpha/beta hydrolase [Clostridia bacterium]
MASTSSNPFNEDYLLHSDHYGQDMKDLVLPALAEKRVRTTVKGFEDRPIACYQFAAEKPKGTVMIVHGFTENAYKFSEITYSLLKSGYSVLAYDQRGHGLSWRKEGLPDTSLTHVDDFEEYVKDMEIVCGKLLKGMPEPHFVFAHSMGGAVTGLFLERHADVFKKAVLCAPMIAPNRSGLPLGLAKAVCGVPTVLGKGMKRSFLSKPYSGPEDFATSCAAGRERFDWYDAVKQAHPEFQNNSPSYRWILEAVGVTKKLLAPGAPEKIACPVRLYTAETDFSVLPEPQEAFIRRVKQGKRVFVPGSKHEIYRSTDAVFFPWWHEILGFFSD